MKLIKNCRNVLIQPKLKFLGKKVIIFALIFLAALNNGVHSQDTILIMTYNLLNFTETSSKRTEHFKTVIDHINPVILVVQEMISQQSLNIFHSGALNDEYSAGTFIDGSDSDNAANLKDTPIINSIPILQGWNLISVLSETSISIQDAFGGNLENIIIIIKN